MTDTPAEFDLQHFLPYLLNQAAEATSQDFSTLYRAHGGMTRTQWRVVANLGKFGAMTARDICAIAHVEKTKVSRAVSALEGAGILLRIPSETDRRVEILSLTEPGKALFAKLGQHAIAYDGNLRTQLGPEQADQLEALLRQLLGMLRDFSSTVD